MDTIHEEAMYEMCITKRMALLIFSNWLAFLMHLLTASSLSSTGVIILAYSETVYLAGGWHVTDPKCSTGVEQNQLITSSVRAE